jgi:hypothetical protein
MMMVLMFTYILICTSIKGPAASTILVLTQEAVTGIAFGMAIGTIPIRIKRLLARTTHCFVAVHDG